MLSTRKCLIFLVFLSLMPALCIIFWSGIEDKNNPKIEKVEENLSYIDFISNKNLGLIVLCIFITVLAFCLVAEKMVIKPLKALLEDSEKIKCGIPNSPVYKRGEIGLLAKKLHEMAATIETMEKERTILLSSVKRGEDNKLELEKSLAHVKQTALEAQRSEKAKTEFLAEMSHEIRTPIHGVLGMVELLKDTPLNQLQKEYLETISFSGQTLMDLIGDILDLSKIEAGKIELEFLPFNWRQTLAKLSRFMASRAQEKGVELILEYPDNVPSCFTGDAGRLKQVVMNLTSNAIKFTDQGSVTIRVSYKSLSDHIGLIRVAVIDTGTGISQESQSKIFHKFKQVGDSDTQKSNGTGLGLAICKELIELMGGIIGVQSEIGKGSTFFFEIKLASIETALLPKYETKSTPIMCSKNIHANILLVEDNQVNQKVVCALLEKLGCVVDITDNGVDAVEKVKSKQYDIILMDCLLPKMNGYEATKRIRHYEQECGTKSTVVIAMTANAIKGDKEKCLNAGMDDYISKPFHLQELQKIISKYHQYDEEPTNRSQPDEGKCLLSQQSLVKDNTKIFEKGPEIKANVEKSLEINDESFAPQIPIFDERQFEESTNHSQNLMIELVNIWLSDVPAKLDRLKSAIANKDLKEIQWVAHDIKGSAGLMRCPRMIESAKTLEMAVKNASALDKNLSALDKNASALDKNLSALDKNVPALDKNAPALDKNLSTLDKNASTLESAPAIDKNASAIDKNAIEYISSCYTKISDEWNSLTKELKGFLERTKASLPFNS